MPINNGPIDDGYRGYLKNPKTGRVFRANRVLNKRGDLVRVKDLEGSDRPTVRTGRDETKDETKDAGEASGPVDESAEAMAELLRQSRDTDDKELLKTLGAQIGLSLTKAMSEQTMRDRIEERIAAIQAAGSGE